jgi:hypothetical protein
MVTQESIDWLKADNVHDTRNTNKPKFVKMYETSRNGTWYKVSHNLKDGTEILVPATKDEISLWKLK